MNFADTDIISDAAVIPTDKPDFEPKQVELKETIKIAMGNVQNYWNCSSRQKMQTCRPGGERMNCILRLISLLACVTRDLGKT